MERRTALSPKKLRSANILPTSHESTPGSPTKKARTTRTSPYHIVNSVPTSPTKTRRKSALSPPPDTSLHRHVSPIKLSPYRVFTEDKVYATDIDSQLATNDQLVLSPPQKSLASPSPRKRVVSPSASASDSLPGSVPPRRCLASLQETARVPRVSLADPFALPKNAFLTPPRPRLSPALQARNEERLCKSASPVLGCRRSLDKASAGFTIYVDSSEYYAVCDSTFSRGRDVNKENLWKAIC